MRISLYNNKSNKFLFVIPEIKRTKMKKKNNYYQNTKELYGILLI